MTTALSCFYAACGAHHGVDNHPPECQPGQPPEGAYVCEPCRRDTATPEPYQDEELARELAAKAMANIVAREVYPGDIASAYHRDPRVADFSYDRLEALETRARELALTASLNPSWPNSKEPTDPGILLADARAVAGLCRSILAELPSSMKEWFGDAWSKLPDWFTEQNNDRPLWHAEDLTGGSV
jgi:hypothetical protein